VGCGDDDPSDPSSPGAAGELPPPEVTTIRLPKTYAACTVPMLFAEEFLYEEGFTDVEFVTSLVNYTLAEDLAAGVIDVGYKFIPNTLHAIDQGLPLIMLGPAHTACVQILAFNDEIQSLADLRGRRVGQEVRPRLDGPFNAGDFAFLSSVLQWIGISPTQDVELVAMPDRIDVDAQLTYAPKALSFEDSRQGRVIFDASTDEPWSQNLCCGLVAGTGFVDANPIATRRAVRAVLKAIDHCATDPEGAALRMYEKGWSLTHDYATRSLAQVSFGAWRTHDLEDAIRFYGLKLYEAGLIERTPDELIAEAADWTFFDELKRELAMAPGADRRNLSFYCDAASSPVGLSGRTVAAPRLQRARRDGQGRA
jgi:NitT/TauT family transport system substrate-binding protein